MKNLTPIISLCIFAILPSCADPASSPAEKAKTPAPKPVYVSESALPEGWPAPGPFNQVTKKTYPAYRAAFTSSSSPNGGFWTLFKHIKRSGIPMTSPVEMTLKNTADVGMEIEQMGFLYQSPKVGKTGADGETVEVRDVPALSVLGYTWQGPRSDAEVAKARAEIDAALAEKKLKATSYRLFGYNGPSVSKMKQTHELQAVLE
ncbi:MAG: heme-binding protein [Luteolibacter sp.]